MRWFRSNRGGVAWLAFFALACQLLLSFGHVHVGKFSGGSAAWATAESGDASADVPPSSPQKNPTGLAGAFDSRMSATSIVRITQSMAVHVFDSSQVKSSQVRSSQTFGGTSCLIQFV